MSRVNREAQARFPALPARRYERFRGETPLYLPDFFGQGRNCR